MKKILILGAGIYQVPLIKTAKKMGLFTIVTSYPGNYPGWQFADKKYHADTTDEKKILKIAKKEKIDAICTTGTDVAIKTLGYVVDKLNLKGPSYKTGELSTNKLSMKAALIKNKVRTAKFITVKTIKDAKKAFNSLKKPVIFKTPDSSGSRGIFKINKENEIPAIHKKTLAATKKSTYIIEEFIEGVEFGAQAMIYNGKIKFLMPHGDILHTRKQTSVPIGHYVPYPLSKITLKDLKTQLNRSLKALKINNAAINADFIMKNNKIYIIEIGSRAGATCLAEIVSTYYGINYFEEIIRLSLGKIPRFKTNKFQPCAGYLIISKKSGTIKKITTPATSEKNIIDLSFDYNPGDKICKFNVGPDRIGQIVTKGKTANEALKKCKITMTKIKISL